MEYNAALKEKANTQAERIIELEASMDDQNVLIDTTDCAERAVDTGTNNKMEKIKAMMKQLADYVTVQAATMASLSTKINGGISRTGENTDNKE